MFKIDLFDAKVLLFQFTSKIEASRSDLYFLISAKFCLANVCNACIVTKKVEKIAL